MPTQEREIQVLKNCVIILRNYLKSTAQGALLVQQLETLLKENEIDLLND